MSETDEIDLLEENEAIEKPTIQKKKKAFENPAPKVVIKKRGSAPARQHKKEIESDEEGGSEPLGSDKDEEPEPKPVKQKRERTQKQIDAFNRCIEKKKEKAAERNENARKLAAYEKAALEEKVVKKAISIKKKQIKKQSALDEISDDETSIEKIKRNLGSTPPNKPIEKPTPAFKFI